MAASRSSSSSCRRSSSFKNTTTAAVNAAVAVAEAHGLRCDDPVVLRAEWHVLVHLRPLPIVARVSSDLQSPDIDPEQVVRELNVAAHAARAGAAVIPPAPELPVDAHRYQRRIVTFWRYVRERGPLDARAAGRRLREIHDALADFEGALPPAGHPADVATMLASLEPSADVDLLREVSASAPRLDGQALHGDAHLDNCLQSASGPLWHDLECACRGPREYDLAALVHRDRASGGHEPARRALAAYGSHDADAVDALVPIYAAWVYASMLTALPRRPGIEPLLRERLGWLRGDVASGR